LYNADVSMFTIYSNDKRRFFFAVAPRQNAGHGSWTLHS